MAAQVEVQTGEVGRTGVGGRLHLSPLSDSSNKSLIEGPSSTQGSLIITPEPTKPVLGPKPRLTPKPFAVERNPTVRPILAPKPQTKPRPEPTRPAGYKPDPPNTPKPQQSNVTQAKPRPVSTNPNRPSPTSFKPSPKLNTGQTTKPVVQPFKPAPPLSHGDPSKPTPPKPAERQKPGATGVSHLRSPKKPPAAEWSGTTKKEDEKDKMASSNGSGGTSMTRAKSMGFLSQIGQEEKETKHGATVALRPQPRGSRPRPVSAIFFPSPTTPESSTPSPRWTGRRPLSADLTSKFESVGLSLYRKPPSASSKENTPEERAPPPWRSETENGSEGAATTPQGAEAVAKPADSGQGNEVTKRENEKVRVEEKGGGSIKRRISLLLDSSSSPGPGASGQGSEPHSPAQPIPEADAPLGVRQRIKQLTEDVPPAPSPPLKPTPKPRPLPLDLTKRFTTERSTELSSPSFAEATDPHESDRAAPRRVEESTDIDDQEKRAEDSKVHLTHTSPDPMARRSEDGQMADSTSKDSGPSSEVQTVRASLFENVVERHSVLVLDEDQPKDKGKAPLGSPFLRGDGEDEGTLVTATYREPMSPSSPLRVLHSFDTVQAVEESRALSEMVSSAQLEDKAMTLRSRRSEGSRPDRAEPLLERPAPVQGEPAMAPKPEHQPRYLRVGALQKWNATDPVNEAGTEKGTQRDGERERQMALEKERERQREAEGEEAAAAPKRLKMLEADEQPKPRATYFALTGQIQEPVSPGDTGAGRGDTAGPFDDFSVRSGQRGSQGKILPARRNPLLDEAFGKSPQSPNQGEEQMERSHTSERERGSARGRQAKEEEMEVEKQREMKRESERQQGRMKELEREKQRQLELERQQHLEFARMKERERQREFERQRQKEFERERHQELERQKHIELERQKQIELERQKLIELERQKLIELERQKQMELERQKQMELERERQRQLERERQRQLERERQQELERERQRQLERERQQELERERQQELERERQRELERERQRQLERERQQELERERQRELERERERQLERERQRELERERQRELERERQRELERERQRELERERQRELERERQRELERERQRELERERKNEIERERLRELEKERQRLREQERQRELDRERELLEIQRERQRQEELEKIKELERRQLLEFELQKQAERERQQLMELEKRRLRERMEREEAEKVRQAAIQQEADRQRELERQREVEKERCVELERERQRELQRQRDLERQKQLDAERLEMEKQRSRQRELEKDRQRKEEAERLKEMERRQFLEFERQRQQERERQQLVELEKLRLREREEAERERQIAEQQEAERQRLKEKQRREEQEWAAPDLCPLRPKVLDLDSVLRDDQFPRGSPHHGDPATWWKQPSPRADEPYKPAILDIDSFTSQTQPSPNKEAFPVAWIQAADAGSGARSRPLTPERDASRRVPQEASLGRPSPVWAPSPQDPWELRPGEMSVDSPVAGPEPPSKPAGNLIVEQLLLRQEERHTAPSLVPERHWSIVPHEPPHLSPFSRREANTAGSPGRVSGSTSMEQLWYPREPEPQGHRGDVRGYRRSQGSQELNRMRSRSVSRRSAPLESAVEGSLSRMRSRSAHRERDRRSWVQPKQSVGSDEEVKDTDTLVHDTDSQYGTWETGLRTDDSLTPATPTSDSNLSPSPRKPTPPHTPGERASSINLDTPDGLSPTSPLESQLAPFPEAPTALLDTSAMRSRAQLSKKRGPRSRPSRAARQSVALTVLPEGGATEDWRYRDSTEDKPESKQDSDSEEPARGSDPRSAAAAAAAAASQPQRIPLFPGMDPSALKAQLKKRGDADNQTDGPAPSPSQLSRSPKSPFLPRAARVLPPAGGKENGREDSPQWLRELKSKKRLSQYENDG